MVKHYVDAICKEISLRKIDTEIRTIYFGGGTPTVISCDALKEILKTVQYEFKVHSDAEITIEANPSTITEEKAESLLEAGINRISMGVQSFVDYELDILGRSHGAEDAIKSFFLLRKAGFKNISIDLIYGVPFYKGQIPSPELQVQRWKESLEVAMGLSPEHISVYELTLEKDTPLYGYIKSGIIIMPDEDVISEMYYTAMDWLKKGGYLHYEISNFAKLGYECRHNMNYWERGQYIGIGAGAFSFINGRRFSNIRDLSGYIKSINDSLIPVDEEMVITERESLKEFIFLGLRKTEGIDIGLLPEDKHHILKDTIEDLYRHRLVDVKNNHLMLTEQGIILSNEVISQILLCID